MRLLVGMIAVFALFSAVVSADQQQQHFEVPASWQGCHGE
jgi:hypothetical protein